MKRKVKRVVDLLTKENKTISTMESCTGGAIANTITNIEGSSEVISFSAVTYSNESKIKMGVNEKTISKHSVYSKETVDEMSKAITDFANSNYGVGITGKLNRVDNNNPYGDDNIVYISIYDKDNNIYHNEKLTVKKKSRKDNKSIVINKVMDMLTSILEDDKKS